MNIGNEIKKLAVDNGMTLTHLANVISEKRGKHYSVQNLSTKLKKGTVNFNELNIILDEMKYTMTFNKIEKH